MRGLLLIWWQLVFTGAQDIPTTNCKEYIVEGETLSCSCLGDCSNGTEPTLTWPGHSNTDFLEKHNISRQQHGQNFTCRKVCGKETTEVNYTLQVAYGPDAASSKITGPSPFITNGTLSMTLTCEGTVNPTPIYAWLGVSCDNRTDDRTCTYTPSITEDGKLVKCKLTNPKNSQARTVTVEFAMSLSYPPPTAPNISEGSGSILTAKDILTCTVTGGKPLVDSVNFTCTNPYNRTQDRETTNTSSSLTIDTSQATTDNTTCYCSANWAPRPDFYTMNSERNFLIESPPRPAFGHSEGTDRNRPLNMTRRGIQIELRVFPVPLPDDLTYTHYANKSDQVGKTVSSSMFNSQVKVSGPSSNFVTCTITGKNVPEEYVGVYKVTISNHLGSVEYFFDVKEPVAGDADVVLASTDTFIIIGVSVSAGSLSAVVISVVVVRRRRKGKNASNDDHQTSQSPYYNNPTFAKNGADADTDSGASCHSPDGAGYAAVGDFPSSAQPDGVRRQTSSGSAAYEVTDIAMGRVSIKEAAAPQPNVYQEPWDAVKAQSMVAECFTGHGVIIATGPEGDKHSI